MNFRCKIKHKNSTEMTHRTMFWENCLEFHSCSCSRLQCSLCGPVGLQFCCVFFFLGGGGGAVALAVTVNKSTSSAVMAVH